MSKVYRHKVIRNCKTFVLSLFFLLFFYQESYAQNDKVYYIFYYTLPRNNSVWFEGSYQTMDNCNGSFSIGYMPTDKNYIIYPIADQKIQYVGITRVEYNSSLGKYEEVCRLNQEVYNYLKYAGIIDDVFIPNGASSHVKDTVRIGWFPPVFFDVNDTNNTSVKNYIADIGTASGTAKVLEPVSSKIKIKGANQYTDGTTDYYSHASYTKWYIKRPGALDYNNIIQINGNTGPILGSVQNFTYDILKDELEQLYPGADCGMNKQFCIIASLANSKFKPGIYLDEFNSGEEVALGYSVHEVGPFYFEPKATSTSKELCEDNNITLTTNFTNPYTIKAYLTSDTTKTVLVGSNFSTTSSTFSSTNIVNTLNPTFSSATINFKVTINSCSTVNVIEKNAGLYFRFPKLSITASPGLATCYDETGYVSNGSGMIKLTLPYDVKSQSFGGVLMSESTNSKKRKVILLPSAPSQYKGNFTEFTLKGTTLTANVYGFVDSTKTYNFEVIQKDSVFGNVSPVNTCYTSQTVTLAKILPPTLKDSIDCANDRLILKGNGGVIKKYKFFDGDNEIGKGYDLGDTILAPIHEKVYQIKVQDSTECTGTVTSYTYKKPLDIIDSVMTPTDCGRATGTVTFKTQYGDINNPTFPTKYTLNETPISPTETSPNIYLTGLAKSSSYILGINDGRCEVIQPFTIKENAATKLVCNPTVKYQNCSARIEVAVVNNLPSTENTIFLINATDEKIISSKTVALNGTCVFDNLANGSYKVYGRDKEGCTSDKSNVLTVNFNSTPPALSTTVNKHEVCAGDKTGKITATATANAPNIMSKYEFATSSDMSTNYKSRTSNNVFDTLSAGTYYFRVTDDKGCKSAVDSKTINGGQNPGALVAAEISVTKNSCSRKADGEIKITKTSTSIAKYKLYDGSDISKSDIAYSPTAIFNSLADGNYKIKVEDNQGCISAPLAINVDNYTPSTLTLASWQSYQDCKRRLVAKILGIKDPSANKFTFYSSDNTPVLSDVQGKDTAGGYFVNGTYKCIITDKYNCSYTTPSVIINNITQPSLSVPSSSISYSGCKGSVPVSFTNFNGASNKFYLDDVLNKTLNVGAYTFPDLTMADYTVKVVDAYGCFAETNVTVNTGDSPGFDADPTVEYSNSNCDKIIKFDPRFPNSGNTVQIYKDGSLITTFNQETPISHKVSNSGVYSIVLTDAKGCSNSKDVTVANHTKPKITFTKSLNGNKGEVNAVVALFDAVNLGNTIEAKSGTNVISPVEPVEFIRNNATDLTGKAQALYNNLTPNSTFTLNVTDNYGCFVDSTITVDNLLGGPTFSAGYPSKSLNSSCLGTITVKGVYNNVKGTLKVVLLNNEFPVDSLAVTNQSSEYSFSNLQTGKYKIVLVDAAGLSDTSSEIEFKIPLLSQPSLNVSNCSTTISLSASQLNSTSANFYRKNESTGYQRFISSSTGSSSFVLLGDSTFTFWVQDSYGCKSNVERLNIAKLYNPAFKEDNPNPAFADSAATFYIKPSFINNQSDGTAKLLLKNASNGYDLKNSITAKHETVNYFPVQKVNGEYKIELTDALGCSNFIIKTVNIQNAPAFASSYPMFEQQTNCKGKIKVKATFNNSGSECKIILLKGATTVTTFNSVYSNTEYEFPDLDSSTYTIQLVDAVGRIAKKSVNVTIRSPKIKVQPSYANCLGKLTLTATNYNNTVCKFYLDHPVKNDSVKEIAGSSVSFVNLDMNTAYKVKVVDNINCASPEVSISIPVLGVAPVFASDATLSQNPLVVYDACVRSIKVKPDYINQPLYGKIILNRTDIVATPTVIQNAADNAITAIPNVNNGTYKVTLMDSAGCFVESNELLVNYNIPTLTLINSYENCKGVITAKATIFDKSKNTLFTLLPDNATKSSTDTFAIFKSLTPGNSYTVKVKDGYNCEQSKTTSISALLAKPAFNVNYPQYSFVACKVSVDAQGTFNNAGNKKYVLFNGTTRVDSLINPSGVATFSNKPTGNYKIMLVDGAGCYAESASKQMTINSGPLFNSGSPSFDYHNCKAIVNVDATFANAQKKRLINIYTSSSASTPFKSKSIYPLSKDTLSNLTVQNYWVELEDSLGCKSAKIGIVSDYKFPTITATPSFEKCAGKITIEASVYNNTKQNKYVLDDPSTILNPDSSKSSANLKESFTNLTTSKTFRVKLIDGYNCTTAEQGVTIGLKNSPPSFSFDNISYSSCKVTLSVIPSFVNTSQGNGKIYFYRQGDVTPRYTISNAVSGTQYSYIDSVSGNYRIVLEDSYGCTSEITRPVTINPISIINPLPVANYPGGCLASIFVKSSSGNSAKKTFELYNNNLLVTSITKNADTNTFLSVVGNPSVSYILKVKDDYGCVAESSPVLVSINSKPSISRASLSYEQCKGSIEVIANFNNGNSNKFYLLNSAGLAIKDSMRIVTNSQYKYRNLLPSTYYVQAVDAYGCSSQSEPVVVGSLVSPTITKTLNVQYDKCSGVLIATSNYTNFNGLRTSQLINITSGYSISAPIEDVSGQITYAGLSAGTYKIKITDGLGCSDSSNSVVVEAKLTPTIDNSVTKPAYASCKASLNVKGTFKNSGSINYFYLLNSPTALKAVDSSNVGTGAITPIYSFSKVANGTYWIKLKDSYGCQAISSDYLVSISEKPQFENGYPLFKYDETGNRFIDVNAIIKNSGATSYRLIRSDNRGMTLGVDSIVATSTNQAYSFVEPFKKYEWVRVVDVMGCQTDTTFVKDVNISAKPQLVQGTIVHNLCNGQKEGSISVQVKSGTGSGVRKTFSLFLLQNSSYGKVKDTLLLGDLCMFGKLGAGTYKVSVTDSLNASASLEGIVVNEPTLMNINAIYVPIKCNGDKTTITITAIGGTAPYYYSINQTNYYSTNVFNNVTAGLYKIAVKDKNNCIVKLINDLNVIEPSKLTVNATVNATKYGSFATSCYNSNDAEGTATITGGVGSKQITWKNGSNVISQYSLRLGDNIVTVIDENGCQATDKVTITESMIPGKLNLDAIAEVKGNNTHLSCYKGSDGKITGTASGGSGIYDKIYWTNSSGEMFLSSAIEGLKEGNYKFYVIDSRNCGSSIEKTITGPSQPFIISSVLTSDPSCFNGSNGSLTVNIENGTSPYTYRLNNNYEFITNEKSNSTNNLPASIYKISVVDKLGCSVSDEKELKNDVEIKVNYVTGNVTCYNNQDGTIITNNISGPGNMANYTYKWFKQNDNTLVSTSKNLASQRAGKYYQIITSETGCSKQSEIIEIKQPDKLEFSFIEVQNAGCKGESNGLIDVYVSGGTPNYSYLVNSISKGNTSKFLNLSKGNYQIDVTDVNSCTIDTVILISDIEIKTQVLNVKEISCKDASDAQISVSSSGGANYSYYLNGVNYNAVSNFKVGVGSHNIYSIDNASGCYSDTVLVPINNKAELKATPILLDSSACNKNIGKITANVTGGSGAYNVKWVNLKNNGVVTDLNNLYAGNYKIEVEDKYALSCKTSATITVPERLSPNITGFTLLKDAWCNKKTAKVKVNVSGGTPSYSYAWNDSKSQTTVIADSLRAGSYNVEVTDIYGCSDNESITLNNKTIDFSSNADSAHCGLRDGKLQITFNSSYKPYKFNINGNLYNSLDTVTFNSGWTNLYIVDTLNGCEFEQSFNIPSKNGPIITSNHIVKSYCGLSTGNAQIQVSGGTAPYSYSWYKNNSTVSATSVASNLAAGEYRVEVKDESNCKTGMAISVTDSIELLPQLSVEIIDSSSCEKFNGKIKASPTKGLAPFTYLWNDPGNSLSQEVDNLRKGQYVVELTDGRGCKIKDSIILKDKIEYMLYNISQTKSYCGKPLGSVILSVNEVRPPYSIYKNGENTGVELELDIPSGKYKGEINALYAGTTYNFEVKDGDGCTSDALFVEIVEDDRMKMTLQSKKDVSCYGYADGEAKVDITNGKQSLTYMWNGEISDTNFSNKLHSGKNLLKVTDAIGCELDTSIFIGTPDEIQLDNISKIEPLCTGDSNGKIFIATKGGLGKHMYKWNNNSTGNSMLNVGAGNYSVEITDVNTCKKTESIYLSEPLKLELDVKNIVLPSCKGKSDGYIDIEVKNGTGKAPYDYKWTNETGTILPVGAKFSKGHYVAEVKDVNGCIATKAVLLGEPEALLASVVINNPPSCYGKSDAEVMIAPSGGIGSYSVVWDNNIYGNKLSNTFAGKHFYKVTDSKGCTYNDSVLVSQPDQMVLQLNILSTPKCFNSSEGKVKALVTGGIQPYTYMWNNQISGEEISNLYPGNYLFTAKDKNNCAVSNIITIAKPSELHIDDVTLVNPKCFNQNSGSIKLIVSGGQLPYKFTLGGDDNSTGEFNNLVANNYSISVADANNCSISTSSLQLVNPDSMDITASITQPKCFASSEGSINLSVKKGTQPYKFSWDKSLLNTNLLTGLTSGIYNVTVSDANNCSAVRTYKVDEPLPLNIDKITKVNPTCFKSNNGSLNVEVSGGKSPYLINWKNSNGIYLNSTTSLSADTYTAEIFDQNYCFISENYNLVSPEKIDADIIEISDPKCYNESSGYIRVQPKGGNGANYSVVWLNETTNENIVSSEGLKAGKYKLTITDDKSCSSSISYTLSNPRPIDINAEILNQPSCNGFSDGSIEIIATGGTGLLSYYWGAIAGTAKKNGLISGSYTCKVKDDNGCYVEKSFDLSEPKPINISVLKSDPLCYASGTGSIEVSVSGGKGGILYNWSDNKTYNIPSRKNLSAGVYIINASDINNCKATKSVELKQPEKLLFDNFTVSQPKCYNAADGSILSQVIGGVKDYKLSWFERTSKQLFSNGNSLKSGIYNLSVTDANNCKLDTTVQLLNPVQLGATYVIIEPSCKLSNDGSLTVIPKGGFPDYSVLISGKPFSGTYNALIAGIYDIEVKDQNACVFNDQIEIKAPAELVIKNIIPVNPSCYGYTNGSIEIMAEGGTPGYSYLLNLKAGGPKFVALGENSYNIKVVDAKGCFAQTNVSLTQPQLLKIKNYTIKEPLCADKSTGSFELEIEGGAVPYATEWVDEHGLVFTKGINLTAGTYKAKVKDNNNCTTSLVRTIANPLPVSISLVSANPACSGSSDGFININASGGAGDYKYYMNNIEVSSKNSGLDAKDYNIKVVDGNGCEVNTTRNLVNPLPMSISTIIKTSPTCSGKANGKIEVIASGGKTPLRYRLNGVDGLRLFSGLAANTYTINVIDQNGCVAAANEELSDPPILKFEKLEAYSPKCFDYSDGGFAVKATGGNGMSYSYKFVSPSGNVTSSPDGLKAGRYAVTVYDANSCNVTEYKTIENPIPLSVSFVKVMPVCNGMDNGKITANVSGGAGSYKYNWQGSEGSNELIALKAGTYVFSVTDNHNCLLTKDVSLDEPAKLQITKIESNNPLCFGSNEGSIKILTTGGSGSFSYYLNNEAALKENFNLKANNYDIIVADANGCKVAQKVTLSQPGSMSITITDVKNPTCFDSDNGSVLTKIDGGTPNYIVMYQYNDGTRLSNSNALKPGTFAISVIDTKGCKALSNNITLVAPSPITVSKNIIVPKCYSGTDGSIKVTSSGGTGNHSYYWNGNTTKGSSELLSLAKGTYSFRVVDENNCEYNESILLTEPQAISLTNFVAKSPSCFDKVDGSIDFSVSGGTPEYVYSINGEVKSKPYNSLPGGTYTIRVTDKFGCFTEKNSTLKAPGALILNVDKVFDVTCPDKSDGSFTVSTIGQQIPFSYTYLDQSGNQYVKPEKLSIGKYSVTVTDAKGCKATKDVSITAPGSVTFTEKYTMPLCFNYNNGSLEVTPSGGIPPYRYLWSNGKVNNKIIDIGKGSYTIKVTDKNGCSLTRTLTLLQPDELNINAFEAKSPLCYKGNTGSVRVIPTGGTPPYNYLWDNGKKVNPLTSLIAGNYSVTVTDANGCSKINSYKINDPAKIVGIGLPVSETVCPGSSYTIAPAKEWLSCKWYSANGFVSSKREVTLTKPGVYIATAINANNCTVIDTFELFNNNSILNALFLMQDTARVNKDVKIFEVSQPEADRLTWQFPDGTLRRGSSYSIEEVAFTREGKQKVTLIAYLGECTDTVTKTITIYPDNSTKDGVENPQNNSIITKFTIYPNPTSYEINSLIEFEKEAPVEIQILNANSLLMMEYKAKGQKVYQFKANVSQFKPGIYIIKIITENATTYRTMVVTQ